MNPFWLFASVVMVTLFLPLLQEAVRIPTINIKKNKLINIYVILGAIPTTKPDGGISSTEGSCADKRRTVIFINKDTVKLRKIRFLY